MAQTYGQIKTMKTAKIGTVMPWAGDGNVGELASNVPRGWILCDGRVYPADRYPLLASIIGNSYGGTDITGNFPHFEGTVKVPDISGRLMIDLEPAMLFDPKYQAGQSDAPIKLVDVNDESLIVDDGFTKSIPTLISADTNIVFTIDSDLIFNGKIKGGPGESNITLSDPSFTTTVYTIGRKLGINHTPSHNHGGKYTTATGGGPGPELFSNVPFEVGGSEAGFLNCPSVSWLEATISDPDAPRWCEGRGFVSYYDDTTLIETFEFNEFISSPSKDYSQIPPETADNVVYEALSPYTNTFTSKPITTHAMVAWEGYFPRPMEFLGTRNFFGYGTGFIGPTGIGDDPEYRPAFTTTVTLTAGATTFTVTGTIGVEYNQIRPLMLVDTPSATGGALLGPGTQVLNITRTGDVGSYTYEIELSKQIEGGGTTSQTVRFRDGTYPTSLSAPVSVQDPAGISAGYHDHGTFELTMGTGLKGPTTHPVNDVSKGDIVADPLNGALNILATVANPSQNIVYIIKAF